MKGPISLAQELRAIRNGGGSEGLKPVPHTATSERPWQADIDRLQQTLQEVLHAVSNLSGVELPGAGPTEGAVDSLPCLDCNTLKDRIRNDLEAFSVTTAAEMAKQAEEQTRAALGTVQSEVSGQIDQVAKEFRDKLQGRLEPEQLQVDLTQQSRDRVAEMVQTQTDEFARWVWLTCKGTGTPIPTQIERLLEPYAEEALAKFAGSLRQRVQDLLAEQDQLVQEKLQGTTLSLESQIRTLEQASMQVCERNADTVTRQSAEQLSKVADEAANNFRSRNEEETDAALGRFRMRLDEMATIAKEELQRQEGQQSQSFREKLEELASEVREGRSSEIARRIEQTAANVIESSVQHLYHQVDDATEHSKEEIKGFLHLQMEEVRVQVNELGRVAQESISQDAVSLAESLEGLDKNLAAIENKHIAASEQQLSNLVQGTMESLSERIRQIADTHLGEISRFVQESQDRAASQYESQLREATEGHYQNLLERIQKEAGDAGVKVADEVRTTSESVMQELADKVNASASVLREEAIQATSRIEQSIKSSLETYRQQLAQITNTGLEQQRDAITGSVAELHNRLRQAAELLAGVDSKAL